MEQTATIVTPRQRKAAKKVVANLNSDQPASLGEVMKSVGYSESVQNHPALVTETTGFKQALRDMGLTEDLITTALVEDIDKKKQNRIQELKLGAELLGMVKREPEKEAGPAVSHTYNFIFSAETQQDIKEMEERLKARLIQPHATQNDANTTVQA